MSTSTPASIPIPAWPPLPNETEIYILADGQVIVADLPVELAGLAAKLGQAQANSPQNIPPQPPPTP